MINIDELERAATNSFGDRGAVIYFREMLKYVLSRPLNEWERGYVYQTMERDLKDFKSENNPKS